MKMLLLPLGINSHISRKEQLVSVLMGEEESLKDSYWEAAELEGDVGGGSIIDNGRGTSANPS